MDYSKVKRSIKPFDGEKYSVWKFRIRALLSEIDVIKIIDEDPLRGNETWEKNNKIAKSVIIEYLSDSFLDFAKEDVSAKDILKNLDTLYERKSIATQLALRKKLLSLKLKGEVSLIQHFTTFNDLITELLAAGAKLEETDKVAHLLLSLPSTYDGVITAIETLSEDNITLAFVKTRLLDHEVKLKNESGDMSEKVLQIEMQNNDKSKKRKFHNKQSNKHIKRRKENAKFIQCHHCGRKGHKRNDCYHLKQRNQQKGYNINNDRPRTVQSVEISQNKQSASNEFSGFAFMTGEHETQDDDNKVTFVLDSGASNHIINREDLFTNFVVLDTPLKMSVAKNGEFISATKRGTLQVTSNMGVQGCLDGVLYCPEVPYNLLSVSKMQRAGYTVIFSTDGARICKNGKTVMKGMPFNNLIAVDFVVSVNVSRLVSQACISDKNNYKLWHQRLGHLSKNKFIEIKRHKLFKDVSELSTVVPDDELCEACINGKQSRLPFSHTKDKSHINRPLFAVSSDVCGPITPTTVDNKNYFVMFVDQYTHYCVTYLITYKSDVYAAFKDFVAKSEAKFNLKVAYLFCDNGGEYLSAEMRNYCAEKGISYHLTVPRTPQQNGVSERMVRTITEKARSILNGAQLDKVFWGQAVLTAVYLINLTPTKALKLLKTPYEMWHNKKPELKFLKVFGSTVYVHNKTTKAKFDDKSWKGILMGYEPNGYKVWNPDCEKFVVVRDVIVDETTFLRFRPSWKPEENMGNSHDKTDNDIVSSKSVSSKSRDHVETKLDSSKSSGSDHVEKKLDSLKSSGQDEYPAKIRKSNHDTLSEVRFDNSMSSSIKSINKNTGLRRSDRIKDKTPVSYNEIDHKDYLMCAQSVLYSLPKSFAEIKYRNDRCKWENAIREEINSLYKNETWTLVPRPPNKNIVDCKWIFTVKNDEFGYPQRYKARLVARGFSQEYLTDYNETFAPVARIVLDSLLALQISLIY